MTAARPFVKWVGGKRQLLVELLGRAPVKYERYYEPFLGGGAMFFALAASDPMMVSRGVVLSDLNPELVRAYEAVRDVPDRVVDLLRDHERQFRTGTGKLLYEELRLRDPSSLGLEQSAARTIYLNRVCFNGIYRVNRKGVFNVPYGKYPPTIKICDEDNLRACSEVLRGVEIVCQDFREALKRPRRRDFVYADPPYMKRGRSPSFTAFTSQPFGLEEQAALAKRASALRNRGVHVLLTNADCEAVEKLYQGFDLARVGARRSINSQAGGRGKIGEYVIS